VVSGRYKFPALEHCLCAGEPINPEVMWKWKELTGLDIYEGYGQTETVRINIDRAENGSCICFHPYYIVFDSLTKFIMNRRVK